VGVGGFGHACEAGEGLHGVCWVELEVVRFAAVGDEQVRSLMEMEREHAPMLERSNPVLATTL
jgi:hypothetical protein